MGIELKNRGKIKRALFGYSSKVVLETVLTKQRTYQYELTQLRNKIRDEKVWMEKLLLKDSTPVNYQTSPTTKQHPLVQTLFEHLILTAKSIADLESEIERKEALVEQELELKRKQKQDAEKSVLTTVQYLKALPGIEATRERGN